MTEAAFFGGRAASLTDKMVVDIESGNTWLWAQVRREPHCSGTVNKFVTHLHGVVSLVGIVIRRRLYVMAVTLAAGQLVRLPWQVWRHSNNKLYAPYN